MKKREFARYNDGVMHIYREKDKQTDFSAKRNVSVLEDMEHIAKLAFCESAKREQDLSFAEQNDFSLSLKVKTRYMPNVDNKLKAVIDGYLYDVAYIDKTKSEIFWYLEGVKSIGS